MEIAPVETRQRLFGVDPDGIGQCLQAGSFLTSANAVDSGPGNGRPQAYNPLGLLVERLTTERLEKLLRHQIRSSSMEIGHVVIHVPCHDGYFEGLATTTSDGLVAIR